MSTRDESHIVYDLADALLEVCNKGDGWAREVRMYEELIPLPKDASDEKKQQEDRLYKKTRLTQELLIQAIDAAVDAIPGVDPFVRQMFKTEPAVWSSELKRKLILFKSEVLGGGTSFVFAKQGQCFRDRMDDFRKYQQDLHDLDASALAPPEGQGGESENGSDAAGGQVGKGRTGWREVQGRLLQLCESGEACTSQNALAKRWTCSAATINKAVNNSARLRTWMGLDDKNAPKVQSLNKVLIDKTASNADDPMEIAADIKRRPDLYRRAGQWLDDNFSNAVFDKSERDDYRKLVRRARAGRTPEARALMRELAAKGGVEFVDLACEKAIELAEQKAREDTGLTKRQLASLQEKEKLGKLDSSLPKLTKRQRETADAQRKKLYLFYDETKRLAEIVHGYYRSGLRVIDRDALARAKPYPREFLLLRRFGEGTIILNKQNPKRPTEEESRRILLMTWLMTDTDADKAGLGLTEFEKWPWYADGDRADTEDPADCQGRCSSSWFSLDSPEMSDQWMAMVRRAWAKVSEGQGDHEPDTQTPQKSTMKLEKKIASTTDDAPELRPPDGEWIGPMSKMEIAQRILKDRSPSARWRKVAPLFDNTHIQEVTPRTFRFRIDQLDKPTQALCRAKTKTASA